MNASNKCLLKKWQDYSEVFFVDCYECTRTINGITIYDSFDSIGEWLESEANDNDQA